MAKMNKWDITATTLVLVGGLNWGLVGLFGFDLVQKLGELIPIPMLAKVIYIVVGVSAVYSGYKLLN